MRKAFVVMAYKDPEQIERLVKRMSDASFHFYIHVDNKSNKKDFEYLEEYENVFLTKVNNRINWAGFSFTKTLISCMQEALISGYDYDFISSFSGQDYPVKSNDEIISFFDEHMGKSFFSLAADDSPWWDRVGHRYGQYHMTDYSFRGRYVLQRFINFILPKRNFYFFKKVYGGPRATWWTMSADCARYVIEYFNTNIKLQKFIKHTWAPDEFLIPSIVMNSDFKDSVMLDSKRYIDWSQGGANPKIMTLSDYDSLLETEKLFARKFDFSVDQAILDKLDKHVHSPEYTEN